MNEVMNAILTRRSIRKYENKAVPGELLEQILQAGIYAPSGKNRQTQRFFVMREAKNKEQLRQVIGQALDNPAYTFYGADTLIFVMVDPEETNGLADGTAALENMMLAAHSLGLGSCWINQLKYCGHEPEVKAVLAGFRIPHNLMCVGILAVGYPAEAPEAKPRRDDLITYID